MGAPSATPRVTPTGLHLRDGYQSLVTFEDDPDCGLWEVEVTPPGRDIGDKIDQTTMHNSTYRTAVARSLIEVTDGSIRCAYDPLFYTQLLNLIGANQVITVTLPDGSTDAYWGCMKSFIPDGLTEGNLPTANVVFFPTNLDDDWAEQAPVHSDVAGT